MQVSFSHQKHHINPYYLGIKMFEDIEERYNNPTEEMKKMGVKPGSGREKMFEVREIESDISFIRNYLKKELVDEKICIYFKNKEKNIKLLIKNGRMYVINFVNMRVNGGFPYIVVEDGDYLKNGELYLNIVMKELSLISIFRKCITIYL